VLTGGFDRSVILWDAETGAPIRRLAGHTAPIMDVAFLPDGRRAVSSSLGPDRTIRLWDVDTGQEIQRFHGHTSQVNGLAVSRDGRWLLSSDFFGHDMRLWDVEAGAQVHRLDWGAVSPTKGSFSRDGRHAVWAGNPGVIRLYRLTGAEKDEAVPPIAPGRSTPER
jgi:WD40 repeat protein